MLQRKPYLPPRVSRQEFGSDYLKWMAGLESGTQELPVSPERKVEPDYKAVVNNNMRFVEVSDVFCKLVGCTREQLLGMRYDDLTAPNTNDIPIVLGQLLKLVICTDCGC
jgi:PAS domain-containing protein